MSSTIECTSSFFDAELRPWCREIVIASNHTARSRKLDDPSLYVSGRLVVRVAITLLILSPARSSGLRSRTEMFGVQLGRALSFVLHSSQ
jgi:hypothetical protein